MTEQAPASGSRPEPLSVAWRFFAAPSTLLILLALLAAALVLSTLIPQIPAEAATNPQHWLTLQPGAPGRSNALAQALGLYGVYEAWWFRLLLVLTGLALFAWAVESAELAWRASRGRWPPPALGLWGSHPPRVRLAAARAPDEAAAALKGCLARQGYRWAEAAGLPARNLVASRRGALLWGRPAAFGGLLLALLGLAITTYWGWQSGQWRPAAGDRLAVGHGTGYTIRLDAFEQLSGGRYESRITWLDGEAAVGQGIIGVGRPATRGGLAARQVGHVPDVTLRGQDQAGKPLRFQPGGATFGVAEEVSLAFDPAETQQVIVLPDQGFFLLLNLEPGPDGGGPALHVALLRSAEAEQQPLAVVRQSGAVSLDGLRLEVDLGYRPVVEVDYRPGMALAVAGIVVAAAGLAVGWLGGPRLVWAAVAPDGDQTAAHLLAAGGAGAGGWLSRLAAELGEALADGG